MENSERLVVLTTPSKYDGVRQHVERAVETHGKKQDLIMKQLPHMEVAINCLKDGTGDILGMSAFDWENYDTEGLAIVGLLSRKEPTWVLVSDDKPEYLPSQSILVCDSELLHRQMLRLRYDLTIFTSKDMAEHLGMAEEYAQLDEDDRWPWFEQLRIEDKIQGFIVPRSVHSGYRFKSRRHTLGLQRNDSDQNRERFIPPPLHGFTLLVARKGFVGSNISAMLDPSAFLAYRLENAIMDSLDPVLHERVGVHVEQRKISTILREATRIGDESTQESMLNPEGKAVKGGPRVELMIETLNPSGSITAACERVVLPENSHIGMVNLLREFLNLVTMMSTDHEELKRTIPGMPAEFSESSLRMMDYDES